MFYNVGISLHRKNMTLFTLYSTMLNNVMSVNQYNDQHVCIALDTMYYVPVLYQPSTMWETYSLPMITYYFHDDQYHGIRDIMYILD